MIKLLESRQEITSKGYKEYGSAPNEKKSIIQAGSSFSLLGKYTIDLQGKEKCLLICKAILIAICTLGLALFSSQIRQNLVGRQIDVLYVKKPQEKTSSQTTTIESKSESKTIKHLSSTDMKLSHSQEKARSQTISKPKEVSQTVKKTHADVYQYRADIFQETLQACKEGYTNSQNVRVKIDNEPMLKETVSYGELRPLPANPKLYKTKFSVITEDTFQVLLKRRKEGANPVGINMANRYHAGGGVKDGCPAQEEALCRRSNHILGLETQKYPLNEFGGIYCPHVKVFREDEAHGFTFMDQPEEVALVAIAFYDLRSGSGDRSSLGLPLHGELDEEALKASSYCEGTKKKIRNMLRIMAEKGHTQIVLGAGGCGAFKNPPTLMSKMFQEVFSEKEFAGRFERVDFAILRIFQNDQANVDAFSKICKELTL